MILITGAAGKTGRAIIKALAGRHAAVRAFVYRAEQAREVETRGASETFVGDLLDVDAFHQAARGVKKLYHICPNVSPFEVEIGKTAISVAKNTKLEHVVYHSVLHPQTEKMPHHWSKLRVEELLLESGLPYTIIQPSIYMQNVLNNWKQIVGEGIYVVPYSVDRKLCMVDLADVAEAVANVLSEDDHVGATYELCGPDAISAKGMAEVISERLGKKVQAEEICRQEWIEQAQGSGLDPFAIDTLVKMFTYYDHYGFEGNQRMLGHLIGRSPATFSDFVGKVIQRDAR